MKMTNGSSTGSSQNKKVNYEALTSNKGKKELNSYWEKNRRSEKAKDNSSSTKHGVGSKKEEHRSTGFKNSQSFKTSKDVEASSAKKQSPKHKSENLLDPRIPQCPSKSGKGFVSTFVRPYSDNSDKNFSQKEGAEISENKKIDEDQPRSEKYAKALTPKLIRKTAAIEKERLQNFSKEEPVEIRTNISETLLSSQLRNGFITRPVTPDKGETYQPTPQPPPPPPQAEFNIINQKEETCMKTFANRVYPPPMLNYPPPPVTMTLNGQRPDFYVPQTLNVQYVRLSIDHREEYQFYPVNINFPFPIAQRMNPPLNFPPPLPPPIPPSAPPPLPLLFHQRILPPRPIPEVVRPLPVPTDPFGEAIAKFEENRSAGLGCILSTVQDYAKGLRSARDFHKDRVSYSVLMNCTTEAPFRLSCMITPQGEHGLHGWYQREKILLVPQDNIALSVVLTIISIESAGQVSVVEFIAAATAHKHLVKILQAFGSHFHATIRLISQRYDQFPLVDDFSELVRSNCCSALIYLQLYGTKFSDEERRKLETQNNIPKVVPDGIVLRGQRLNFTSDQLQAIRLGCSDNPSVVIHSAYGSGKTVVAAAIAAFAASYSTDSTVLLVSQTNAAVGQMAKVLGQFDFYKHLHPLRVEADSITSYTKILFSRTEETSIDLPQILQNFENWYQLSPDEIHDIRRFNLKYRRLVDFVQKHENCCPWGMWEKGDVLTNAQVQEALAFQEFVESLISESHRAMSIVLTYHRPRIICITVDKLVNELLVSEFVDTSRVHCSLRDFLQKADMIIVDEASQLPEFSLLRLLAVLPNTRFRFIGDSKQLAPHAVLPLDHPFVVAGARSTLQLFSDSAQRGLSIASELTTTFRSHPNMNKLPNKLFYNGKLKSGSSHQQRSQILDCLNFPNKKNPLAFIDVAGEHYKNKNGSLGNHQEADTCLELVKSLIRERNISSHRISVVTFYLEQREHLTTMFKYNNIPVHINTVDSIQGSEYDIVIVLTTKTRFTKYEEFFTDPRRINVAITRAKLAQFILGQKTSLLKVNVWKDLVSWFKDNQAIIRSQDLRKIFEPGRNIVDNNLNMLVSLTISD